MISSSLYRLIAVVINNLLITTYELQQQLCQFLNVIYSVYNVTGNVKWKTLKMYLVILNTANKNIINKIQLDERN